VTIAWLSFELVKNGYDAEATTVDVTVNANRDSTQSIIVQGTGTRMTLDDITGKWLELATDSRRRDNSDRTKKFHRLALGEKGASRIASFKLGRYVTLTRAAGEPEYEAKIDWDQLIGQGPFLGNLSVRVHSNPEPKYFDRKATGTRIEIPGLRRKDWVRGDLRKLYRLVTSLASPFRTPDHFAVKRSAPGREGDINDLISPNDFLDVALASLQSIERGLNPNWPQSIQNPCNNFLIHTCAGKRNARAHRLFPQTCYSL
jgi:hypothetical protein